MLRGINKQRIFEGGTDYAKFLECLSEVKKISDFKLFAYCLMGNHIHLLIKVGKESLSQILKRLGTRYVFWFNWKYGRSGHLFQDRFKSEPVEDNDYFLTVLIYIYQNPVVAGLCRNPADYEWCSRMLFGKSELVDELELFNIVSIDTIKEREHEEIKDNLLEPKIGRRVTMSDESAFAQMINLGGVKTATEFQGLETAKQKEVLSNLHNKGASIRQLARLSGLGKGVIERFCRT